MHNSPFLLSAGDTIFGFGLFPTLTFLIAYMTTAKTWYKSRIGRMFVLAQGGTALVSVVVILSLAFGVDYPGRDIVRLIGYGIFVIGQIVLVYTYFIERRNPDSEIPKTKMDENFQEKSRV